MENINLDKIIKADELDSNMILSVPEEIGERIQKVIQGMESKQNAEIEIIENLNEQMDIEESRKMIFKFNDIMLPITILDLPCIIEANKTIDYKTFYKASDISQMMYVHEESHRLNSEDDIAKFEPLKLEDKEFQKVLWKKDYDNKYKSRDGIAKCTRNIRAKRFKRKIKYNHEEIMDVARKLKSIIDNGAANFENQLKNKEGDEDTIRNTLDNQSINLSLSEVGRKPSTIKGVESSNKKRKREDEGKFNVPSSKKINLTFKNENFEDQSKEEQPNIPSSDLKISLVVEPTNDKPTTTVNDKEVIEEYFTLKSEYKKIKQELQSSQNPDEEKLRYKKKLKKRLKMLKDLSKA